MPETRKEDLIDVETINRDFDELMLQEYPGKLFEQNRRIKRKGDKRFFCYIGLEKRQFEEFASRYKGKFAYKTRQFLGFPSESDKMEGVSMN